MKTMGIQGNDSQNFRMKVKFNEFAKHDNHLGEKLASQVENSKIIKDLPGQAFFNSSGSTTFISAKKKSGFLGIAGLFSKTHKAEAINSKALTLEKIESILTDLVAPKPKK
jgi:hypothetical protein